jgi:hypothetical protein
MLPIVYRPNLATINLSGPNDPVTATNLPFDANGNLSVSRSLPRGAGFGYPF